MFSLWFYKLKRAYYGSVPQKSQENSLRYYYTIVLDGKIDCIDRLKTLLLQQKFLVGQAVLLANYVQQCKERYESVAGHNYSGNTQDRR